MAVSKQMYGSGSEWRIEKEKVGLIQALWSQAQVMLENHLIEKN
jgi:hypothetical protein